MSVLRKIPMFHANKTFVVNNCEVCPIARQTRLPFSHSVSKATSIFKLLHMDVWEPYKLETHDGMRYFLTIVDDHSRWTWIFLMRLKSDVLTLLNNFFLQVETQFDRKIKIMRSDNGAEFFNHGCRELFQKHGVIHQSSCPYTPQQNGVVEKRHRHILEIVRAIKFQSDLPDKFWGLCVEAVVYVLNRIPSIVLQNKSPYEVLYNKAPSLLHMRVIGCLCFVTYFTQKDKFRPRAIRSILVGYSSSQKGYKFYDLENRLFFINRDVAFMETIFPFKESLTDQQSCLRIHDQFYYDDLVFQQPLIFQPHLHTDDTVILGMPTEEHAECPPQMLQLPPPELAVLPVRQSTRQSKPPNGIRIM
ncbi:hypothetical protein AABB24_009309 [Solanum stoloniferum]|uniref:Integrase catalytic domain-containing protein n=1 Tax=Solanum stoloniferum TaxID=62892 RepID=A0ABD2UHS2_9SOLN